MDCLETALSAAGVLSAIAIYLLFAFFTKLVFEYFGLPFSYADFFAAGFFVWLIRTEKDRFKKERK